MPRGLVESRVSICRDSGCAPLPYFRDGTVSRHLGFHFVRCSSQHLGRDDLRLTTLKHSHQPKTARQLLGYPAPARPSTNKVIEPDTARFLTTIGALTIIA